MQQSALRSSTHWIILLCLVSSVLLGAPAGKRIRTLDLPLLFEQDQSPGDAPVFRARAANHWISLSKDQITWSLAGSVSDSEESERRSEVHWVRLSLRGSAGGVEPTGEARVETRSSHFLGADASQWRVGNPNFGKVRFREIYPGIDLVFHGSQGQVEYDFEVSPGGDPEQILLAFEGANTISVSTEGNLELSTPVGKLTHLSPRVFQEIDGRRQQIEAHYRIVEDTVGFELGDFEADYKLTIDPVLSFATYLGGSSGEIPGGIAVDGEGNFYVMGSTGSMDYPILNPVQSELAGGGTPFGDLFVTKIDPSGQKILYSTYIGGADTDIGRGIAIDSQGRAVITGTTFSEDFPNTVGAFQTVCSGQCPFVVRLSADGSSLSYSTFIGRGDGNGIALDSMDRAVIVGGTSSPDFPTQSAFQEVRAGSRDGFVSKLTEDGSGLVFSTYLGGKGDDNLTGRQDVAVDVADGIYITGRTRSDDFPMANAYQSVYAGKDDVYLTKLTSSGSLVYSTYLGGAEDDRGSSVVVDSVGNAIVVGNTVSPDFPTEAALQDVYRGGATGDAFVAKFNSMGNGLIFSTYLGGNLGDTANDVAIDTQDRPMIVGTGGGSFPLVNAFRGFEGLDNFVAKLEANGSSLAYSTSITAGDSDVFIAASGDDALVAGNISSGNYLVYNASQPRSNGSTEVVLARVSDAGTLYFAQYANGGGAQSEVLLTNSSDTSPSNATVSFRDNDGNPLSQVVEVTDSEGRVTVQGEQGEIQVVVPPLGLVRIASDGMGDPVPGSATVDYDIPLGGVIRFNLMGYGTAGVGESQLVRGFISPVRRMGISTGVAVYNPQGEQIGLAMRLRDSQGVQVPGGLNTLALGPHEHLSMFIEQLFPNANTENFTGTITVETNSLNALITGTALELGLNPGEFTTLPVTPIP